MRVIIIGGVAGGASAAARLRRLNEAAEIVLLERGPDVSFANCGLPYYIGGEITDRAKLVVTKPKLLRKRFRLDVRTRHEAVSIDSKQKIVKIHNLDKNTFEDLSYDKMILSPGAAPILPPIVGTHLPGVHTLRNLQDTDLLYTMARSGIKRAVVVGGGFIGLEVAENFARLGLDTTIVQRDRQVLGFLDADLANIVHREIRKAGVKLVLGDSITGLAQGDRNDQEQSERTGQERSAFGQLNLSMASGKSLNAEMVVFGIGVHPEVALAQTANIQLGTTGAILVDEHMRTSEPDIYAVGDAIEVRHLVSGAKVHIPLAGPANRQGRIAADHICGILSRFGGVLGTAILRVFGKTAASTGLGQRALEKAKIPFESVTIHPANHAGYFPGAEGMTLKLHFDGATGKILGAQGVGGAGVDKRIDILSMAIRGGMTVEDLEAAELCYAPPYGSAKDPVNMLGFVGAGLRSGTHPQITNFQLGKNPDTNVLQLVDVRSPGEHLAGHIPGSVSIPVDELRGRLGEIDPGRPVVAYCQVGMRGNVAVRILLQNGFRVQNLSGGYASWEQLFGEV